MKDDAKYYKLYLNIKGPVHIGEKSTPTSKKEYIYLKDMEKLIFPDMNKMYAYMLRNGLEKDFQDYMLKSNLELAKWLELKNISYNDMKKWIKYELSCNDIVDIGGNQKNVMTFVKDTWGNPYIPGSSLKGMLRTALLVQDIRDNNSQYVGLKNDIKFEAKNSRNSKGLLKNETKSLESKAFNKLKRYKTMSDAKNDIMSGVVVSDSNPLDINDIILCQKIDAFPDGKKRKINILRECIRPGTRVEFDIKISKESNITLDKLYNAIEDVKEIIYGQYMNKFGIKNIPKGRIMWLGGGTGYITKTVIYSLFEDDKAYLVADDIMRKRVGRMYNKHKHLKNRELGIAPHTIKATCYKGKICQMGMVEVDLEEIKV